MIWCCDYCAVTMATTIGSISSYQFSGTVTIDNQGLSFGNKMLYIFNSSIDFPSRVRVRRCSGKYQVTISPRYVNIVHSLTSIAMDCF